MGLFVTLEDAAAEETARLRDAGALAQEAGAAAHGGSPTRLRVFDLHCDTLDRLAFYGDASVPGGFAEHDANVPAGRLDTLADNDAHISLARTAAYDWCQCFAAFVPDEVRGDAAWGLFERVRAVWERELDRCADRLAPVRRAADVDAAHAAGRTAGLLTVEGASFLEDDRSAEARLDALAEAGVRMVALTWNGPNALGSGNDTEEGLTAFGRACVRELERRGIVVDVSHLNVAGFKDVCDAAARPFAASHSNARAVCEHPRNLADWQLRELADRGGIVGLNFCRDFLSDAHADPTPDDVLRHVDHVLETAGEDVLALGSDYDGCDVPSWLDPCDQVGGLHALLARQFGRTVADKAFFDNAAAFFARAEARRA
ncbi:dipeptidase [Gordonibacter massiliensis (ex Traore et al. 2017)]|uniref:Membrane dipeptidase n=1 Tax=Gordonibacter massiliensis (ex Traore et al. 2017) TaxID=1841863 RepID=A0A842JI67_9ACTN|nr:membrane dipeptidase [Gordonibacter massiliensis (ex Traore et al. 2017)]MBC2890181.1 membrane dipeptidase [Gordonibacter massiliensis (ex Traore et al. 2017)]